MTELPALVGVGLAYVLGATPTSHWVAKYGYDVDLRRQGSGNLGSTNTYRVLGVKAAAPVMALDVAKGWLPVWLFPLIDTETAFSWTLAYGMAAVVGHVFSFWVQFHGGKGIATSAGVFMALAPWATFFAFLAWLATVTVTRIVSLGSLVAALSLPVAVALTHPPGGDALLGFTVLLTAFVFWTHRSNLRRLLRGEEMRLGRAPAPQDVQSDDA